MATKLSEVLPDTNCNAFDIYKIITELKKSNILESLHEKYLSPIIKYDEENKSDYLNFLSVYLESDGHIKKISETMFVHRNTVHYKIRRIEELINAELSRLDVKMYLLLVVTNYNLSHRTFF